MNFERNTDFMADPMTELKMGKITYINASPVYYGLDHGMAPSWMKLIPEVPASLNHRIKTGQVDISPISAAFYAMNHEELLLLPGLSISSHGDVLSVVCVSRYPLEELTGKKVMFSNESATGASLLRMIFSQKNIQPDFLVGDVGDMDQVPHDVDAVMVIGDAALTQHWEDRFEYRFDLGRLWHDMTRLPFVYAVWVVRRAYAKAHPERVRQAVELLWESMDQGYANIDQVIETGQEKLGLSNDLIRAYYQGLFCDMDEKKVKGMGLFFDGLYEQGILKSPAQIEFFDPQNS